MKRVIYKFPLNEMSYSINLPPDSEILNVDFQSGQLHAWASLPANSIHQPDLLRPKTFRIIPTGRVFDDTDTRFIKTVFTGCFVFHVFEALQASVKE